MEVARILCVVMGVMIIFTVPLVGLLSIDLLLTNNDTEEKIIAAIILFGCFYSIIWFCEEIKK